MDNSGYFFFVLEERVYDFLFIDDGILACTDLCWRFYTYLISKKMKNYMPPKAEEYIAKINKFVALEEHPIFAYVKNSF